MASVARGPRGGTQTFTRSPSAEVVAMHAEAPSHEPSLHGARQVRLDSMHTPELHSLDDVHG